MKTLLYFFGTVFLFNFKLFANEIDSLVPFNEIKFESQSEKNNFEALKYTKQNEQLLSLFISTSKNIKSNNAEADLDNFIEKIREKTSSKEEAEKIEYIIQKVNKTYLKSYQLKSGFSEIFENGNYNCISSIALYGIVLTKLNIPYQIKEENKGIYIIAYPNSKSIVIESSKGQTSCFTYAEHYRDKYSKSMFFAGLIPKAEFEKGYSEELFSNYYFSSKPITLLQLASIQYHQLSLISSEERQKQEAIILAQKAYYLDASVRNQITLKYHIINALGSNNYHDKLDVEKLVYLCRFNNLKDVEINDEFIASEYSRLLTVQLKDQPNKEVMEEYHNLILKNIHNKSLESELEFMYHMRIASKALNNWTDKKIEATHIKAAYKIKPNDKDLQSLIAESFNVTMQNTGESENLLLLIEEYCLQYDFLCNRNSILLLKEHCYLDLAYKNFSKEMPEKGEDFLKKADEIFKANGLAPELLFVEKGYVSAAKYYFNKGNRAKAKEYLTKGYQLAPQSILIQDKLKVVN
jgi:hypothetical protein